MKKKIYVLTRVNDYADLMFLELYTDKAKAVYDMEQYVQIRLKTLEAFGWNLNSEAVRVERKNDIIVVCYGEAQECFEINERDIEI